MVQSSLKQKKDMINLVQACFQIAPRRNCVTILILLAFGARYPTTASAQTPTETVRLEFVAEIKDVGGHQRLTGVAPSLASLSKLNLNPGDIVQYKVEKQVVVIEQWSQEFKWTRKENKGKDTIIELNHQSSFTKVNLTFGESIVPKFQLGTVIVDVSKSGQQNEQAQKLFRGSESIGPSGVKPGEPPIIQRPPAAPANASAGKLTLKTLVGGAELTNGAVIPGCTLTLTIKRSSAP